MTTDRCPHSEIRAVYAGVGPWECRDCGQRFTYPRRPSADRRQTGILVVGRFPYSGARRVA